MNRRWSTLPSWNYLPRVFHRVHIAFQMFRLQLITVLLVLLPLLAAASSAVPTEKPADVRKEPETVAGQILKLACEQAQQERDAQELFKKEMPVQENGPRHDRKWATEKKTEKENSKDLS